MSPQEIDTLRKEIKHRMIDLGLDREGSYDLLLPHLSKIAGFAVSKSQLCMSLTGYREAQRNQDILTALQGLLAVWPPGGEMGLFPLCEHIHH
jgi:hypothetical protein